MKTLARYLGLGALGALLILPPVMAGPVEDLSGILGGRTGHSSEDRRSDDKVLGVKVGCHGDTLDCNVRITGVSGRMHGDTAEMSVTYDGIYQRQGWGGPCQKVSSDLGGLEERRVWGSFSFRVTGKAFTKPTLTWGELSEFGEVESATHDANVFALRAVQNAIASAF